MTHSCSGNKHKQDWGMSMCVRLHVVCVGVVGVGRMLTKLAGTHVLQHGVCFHFVVAWRADGGVTCGKKEGQV